VVNWCRDSRPDKGMQMDECVLSVYGVATETYLRLLHVPVVLRGGVLSLQDLEVISLDGEDGTDEPPKTT
jgi:hypothetical protein